MTTKFYSVHVEVGTYVWDVTGNDLPNDVAAAYGLADPLIIGQRWPDSDLQPNVQPEPAEATVSIIAASSTTYPLLSVGDPVAVEFYPQAGFTGNVVSFYGRVATITARPHELGVFYTLGCFDYLPDLQQATVGLVAYPAETLPNRQNRICDEAFVPRVGAHPDWTFGGSASMAPRAVGAATLYDLLMEERAAVASPGNLTELGTTQTSTNSRGNVVPVLVQQITAKRLDPVTPYAWDAVTPGRAMAYSEPLRLATVGGLLSATAAAANTSPSTGSHILDAGNFDFDTTFTQAKSAGIVSQVTITTKAITFLPASTSRDWANFSGGVVSTVQNPVAPMPVPTTNISTSWDTQLNDTPGFSADSDGSELSRSLMDPNRPDPKVVFDVGTLTWQAWNEAANWVVPRLGQLLTVARIAAGKSPTNREWVVGVVSSWRLTVAQGRPTVDFETMQSTNDPKLASIQQGASLGPCRFDSPILGSTTIAQLSTRDTFLDYELVRGS